MANKIIGQSGKLVAANGLLGLSEPPVTCGPFTVSGSKVTETVGKRILRVNERTIDVQGSCLVFGRDIELAYVYDNTEVTVAYLLEGIERWWRVDVDHGFGYRLRFNRPGAIAPESVIPDAGDASVPANVIRFAANYPGVVMALDTGGNLGTAIPNSSALPTCSSVLGAPGGFIASYDKARNLQLAAGATTFINLATPQSVYVTVRYGAPNGGTNYQTPLYVFFGCDDIPASLKGAVKFGDLTTLPVAGSNEVTVTFIVDQDVSSIGAWVPSLEISSGGVNAWSALRFGVWGLANARVLPSTGGVSGGGPGFAGGQGGTSAGSGKTFSTGIAVVPV